MGACMHRPSVESATATPEAPFACRHTTERSLELDYVVHDKQVLGTGMSGPVRLATSRCDGCKYAVKSFRKASLSSGGRAALRSEANIYLSLDHPHIARLNMVYESADDLHFVMEHMEGGELFARLALRRTFAEDVAMQATRQMLLAVAYLHSQNIAHRDIKLENFLYEKSSTDHLKLIDFGFANLVQENVVMSQRCGSLHYFAPEVLLGSYTEKADMWSLGVIVYMLLLGCPLFFGSNAEIFQKIRLGQIQWSSRYRRLGKSARSFVESLLVVDPSKRLTAHQALNHPWLRCKEVEGVTLDPNMLGSLRSFARASQLQRNMLSLMAWSLSAEDRIQLRRHFLAIDHEKTGTISLHEFRQVLSDATFALENEQEAEELFRSCDLDGNDRIQYSEFLAAAMPQDARCREGALRRTFTRFDRNGNGKVSRADLTSVLGKSCSLVEIEQVLADADTSGDGELSVDEFLAYFQKLGGDDGMWAVRSTATQSSDSEAGGDRASPAMAAKQGGMGSMSSRDTRRVTASLQVLPTLLGLSGLSGAPRQNRA